MEIIQNPEALTPIEQKDELYFKRDDYFIVGDFFGSKARSCLMQAEGASGLSTIHTTEAPQGPLVSAIAKILGMPCRIHTTPAAIKNSPGQRELQDDPDIIFHPEGHLLEKAVRNDCIFTKFRPIPAHINCPAGEISIVAQCENIPDDCRSVIVPARSGTTALSIFQGIKYWDKAAKLIIFCLASQARVSKFFTEYHPATLIGKEIFLYSLSGDSTQQTWEKVFNGIVSIPLEVHKTLVWVGSTLDGD